MDSYLQANLELKAAEGQLSCVPLIYRIRKRSRIKFWLGAVLSILLITLFLPWTQNVRAKGRVTTWRPEQRPQELNTIIAGTVVRWYVKEGDVVQRGDTILQLGEVKVDYFDTALLKRTADQITAKQMSATGYKRKADAATTQATALESVRNLKLQLLENKLSQQQLKLNTDAAELEAAENELAAYTRQVNAARLMLDSGAISLSDYEKRKINYQQALAKTNAAKNKWLQSQQELGNLRLEQQATIQEFADKIAKADGDKYASLSSAAGTEAEISKLQNLYASYDERTKRYYLIAPQGGQIVKAKKAGLGEFVKEGEMIVEIVPNDIQYAVELFIRPMDVPLVNVGQEVQLVFDGFPAIVFSGWPGNSYGTFAGKVVAVEKSISENGKFRVLVTENETDTKKWPSQLSMGVGTDAIMLLKEVSIYYELWRTINGFPPQYYQPDQKKQDEKK